MNYPLRESWWVKVFALSEGSFPLQKANSQLISGFGFFFLIGFYLFIYLRDRVIEHAEGEGEKQALRPARSPKQDSIPQP